MPGFNFFYNIPNFQLKRKDSLVCDTISGDCFQVNRFTLNKFMNDKLFIEKQDVVLVIEGVVLNKKQLLQKYKEDSWGDLIYKLYKKNNEFFKEFRGSFSGLVFDREKKESIVFTDHLGTKPLYYYNKNESLFVSSEISDLYEYLKQSNKHYSLDVKAAYNLLSYGYMLNNNTLCEEIKKISPGSYIHVKNTTVECREYYKLPLASKSIALNESEIIERIDEEFRKAIKLQFDKDLEYGYKHFVALSGGLDSRMTSWVAHDMGYVNQINFTFSQSDYLDETIPKKIASDLKHEWIFKALDNGVFLKDLEEVNVMTGGNVLYYGLAHGNSMIKLINFDNLGVIHSGQLGDIVIGSFIKVLSKQGLQKSNGAYSKNLLVKNKEIVESAEAIEQKLIYQRGINGANNGLIASQNYSETLSPFYDINFFEFCLSIPIKLRMGHNLYKKWILTKYPKASEYVWESTKKKINKKELAISYKGKIILFSKAIPLVLYKLGIKKSSLQTKSHMNPLDYWYSTNENIRFFQDKYFQDNINFLIDDKLKNDCIKLYREGNAIEKNQVLSLLSANKMFF